MRKIFMAMLVALIVSVQNFCGAVTIEEARFNGNEKIIYPVVHVADAEIENKINRKIQEEVSSFIKGNLYAAQYYNQKVLDARMNYEVTCNEAGNTVILSIVFTKSRYIEGAAHPATWKHALNINTSSGNRMGFDYLTDIGSGNTQFSLENVSKKLREHAERNKLTLFDDALPLKKLPENFYWDKNLHVHLIFQQYEVAPYAMGIIDVDMD